MYVHSSMRNSCSIGLTSTTWLWAILMCCSADYPTPAGPHIKVLDPFDIWVPFPLAGLVDQMGQEGLPARIVIDIL